MITPQLKLFFALAMALIVSACTTPPAQLSHDGLQLQTNSRFAAVYVKKAIDLSRYDSIQLADCQVAFKTNWLRDQNRTRINPSDRITQRDVDRIKSWLSDSCGVSFKKALQQAPAYRLVENIDSTRSQTLLIKPSIIDLDITAPDIPRSGIKRNYTTSSGEMTLFMELYDATSGEILARVIDTKKDPESLNFDWSTSVSNKADAKRALNRWSSYLRESLDQLYQPQ